MNDNIVVYKTSKVNPPLKSIDFDLNVWKPSIFSLKPLDKSLKYSLYGLFHLTRIFKNSNFQQVNLLVNDREVASMLIIPSHFKYPFMKKNDVQFTYVMTKPEFKGKGYAWKMIYEISKDCKGDLWYVTDEGNQSSIKLAAKMGFILMGIGEKSSFLKIIKLKSKE